MTCVAISSQALTAEHFFDELSASFNHATRVTSDISRYYRIGTEVVCLRFAGEAIISLVTAAFLHLETTPQPHPSLTILCWDSQSTHTETPELPWITEGYAPKGYVEGYSTDTIKILHQPDSGVLKLFHAQNKIAMLYTPSGDMLPYHECVSDILHWWCQDYPFQLVHAGAVGTERGGVLLAGTSGSGKSTAALACLASPLDFAGDDYVIVASSPEPYVYSLYHTGKIVPASLSMFPQLAQKISNPDQLDEQKALIFLHTHYPQKLRLSLPLRALFLPKITAGKDTQLRPASRVEALLAIAPSSVICMKGDRKIGFEKIRNLVYALPAFWLETGSDLSQIPKVISDYLEHSHAS